jgi:multiple sugar transport system substrate-binding protein
MDGNTIYQNQPQTTPNPVPSQAPESLPTSPPASRVLKILKILLGAVVIVILGFVVFNFVVPLFFKGSEEVKLIYWGLWEDEPQFASIIKDFERENPGIKIEYSKQDIKQYRERLMTRSINGNGPDIFRFHNSWYPMISSILLPFPSSVISKEDFDKNYYPVAKNDLIKNGGIIGIPLQVDTLNLYINKDLFESTGLDVPKTWIDFGNYARRLSVKDETGQILTSGAAMGTFSNITHAPDIISMLFAQNGVDLNDISLNINSVSDTLDFYTSFATSSSNVWNESLDESIQMFASGSLAMYFGYSWDFFTIKAMNPDISFEIHPVPSLPEREITVASYWAEGASSKSIHQKEALLFMKYLAQKEVSQKFFTEVSKTRNFGEPYARVDLADSLKESSMYPFVTSAVNARSSYFADSTFDNGLNSQMNQYLENAVNSILEGNSAQSAAETLSQGFNQVLNQYAQ